MMRPSFLLVAICAACVVTLADAAAVHRLKRGRDSASADKLLDKILTNLKPTLLKLDPLKLPDEKTGFSKKIVFITFHGSVEANNGLLHGISKLYRYGNSTLSYDTTEKVLKLSAGVGVSNLNAEYSGHAKFMAISISAHAKAFVDSVKIRVGASEKLDGSGTLSLTSFTVEELKGLSFDLSGLGPLDWILKPVTAIFKSKFHGLITGLIESKVRKILADEISKFKLPI